MLSELNLVNENFTEEPPVSATQRVFQILRHKIIVGEIAPGERLKVEDLKSKLDTGATPIREALSLLTSDQLVERIDQRGFRTAPANKANFEEIFRLRCQLETMALRSSIESGSTEWEESLLLAHYRLSRIPREETDNFERQHKVYHMTLLEACNSPILMRYCSQLYDLNIRYRNLAGKSVDYGSRDVAGEHAEILQATIERDADRACLVLLNHYEKTGQLLVSSFSL